MTGEKLNLKGNWQSPLSGWVGRGRAPWESRHVITSLFISIKWALVLEPVWEECGAWPGRPVTCCSSTSRLLLLLSSRGSSHLLSSPLVFWSFCLRGKQELSPTHSLTESWQNPHSLLAHYNSSLNLQSLCCNVCVPGRELSTRTWFSPGLYSFICATENYVFGLELSSL